MNQNQVRKNIMIYYQVFQNHFKSRFIDNNINQFVVKYLC